MIELKWQEQTVVHTALTTFIAVEIANIGIQDITTNAERESQSTFPTENEPTIAVILPIEMGKTKAMGTWMMPNQNWMPYLNNI